MCLCLSGMNSVRLKTLEYSIMFTQICFAYTGDIDDELQISYSYVDDADSGTLKIENTDQKIGDVGLSDSYYLWKHVCVNINDRLRLGKEFANLYINSFKCSNAWEFPPHAHSLSEYSGPVTAF